MRIPGIKTVRLFSRWIQARLLGGALILGYHRIGESLQDGYETSVSAKFFEEQMQVLCKHAKPIGLSKLVEHLKEGTLLPKSVAITFDDGYADNLYQAKPILEQFEIPATVFVCMGFLGREFWWDELDRMVMLSKTDIGSLRLEVGKKQFVWNPSGVGREPDLQIRRKLRQALYNFLLGLDVEEQRQALNAIRNWSGVLTSEPTARAMTANELLQLVNGGLIQVGAHTRHHPMLPQLSAERQREEIVGCKQDLEALLGNRIDGFAYPNGQATPDSKRIIRDAGFKYACTSLHNVIRPTSDLHELTRFWQKDVDGDTFLQSLHLWMRGG